MIQRLVISFSSTRRALPTQLLRSNVHKELGVYLFQEVL